MLENTIQIIISIAILYGYTLVFVLFKRSSAIRHANKYLSLLLLFFTNYLVWVLLLDLNLQYENQYLLYIPFNVVLAIGPTFYFYVLSLTSDRVVNLKQNKHHIYPLLFELVSHLIITVNSIFHGSLTYDTISYKYLSPTIQFLGISSILFYSYHSFKIIKHISIKRPQNTKKRNWLLFIVISFSIISFSWFLYTIIDLYMYSYTLNIKDYYPMYILISLFICWISLQHIFTPDLSLTKLQITQKLDLDQIKLINTFEKHLLNRKPFLNPKLSISDISKELTTSQSVLSKVINTHYGKNFNKLINEYRVKHFIELTTNEQFSAYSFLGLATESGFTSKASFNRVFKEVTGLNPTEYIEKYTS